MRRSASFAAFIALILTLCLAGACSAAEKKILRYGAVNQKSTLDMQVNTYSRVMDIADMIVEPLLRIDEENKILPVLVKEMPRPSDDGLVYSFSLKPGVKFHDGTTLKASDVKFSFERMFRPSTEALMSYICDMIVGAQDMLEGRADSLAGFKIIDDLNFEITLSYPYAPFLSSIATSYAGIYPEKACGEAGKDWGLVTYIGTGPFKATKIDLDNGVFTERFEDYHGERQPLDGIDFIFVEDPNTRRMEYERGNIDIMMLDATIYPEYASSKLADEIGSYTPLGIIFINPNMSDERLGNVKLREAISLAIDRKAIAQDLMKGTAAEARTFLLPGMLGYDDKAPAFERDVERAKKLIVEAGYPNGVEIESYIRSVLMNAMTGRILLAVQNQLKEAGIDIKIVQVDSAAMTEMRGSGKVPLEIFDWYADFPDPDGFIYSMLYSSNAATLTSNYKSEEFDKLLDDARAATDPAKRAELYKKADRLATRVDFAAIPLFHEKNYYLAKPYVKNFRMAYNDVYHFYGVDLDLDLKNKK
ncbi:MAG: ABC transporter substrate-binding protein [Synergistaceae bacterium]|jgi:peptide/nickel transport system substrate-binding protein|nr:ABC transporter substrate-binding protein [Synergistaceae bacterium]